MRPQKLFPKFFKVFQNEMKENIASYAKFQKAISKRERESCFCCLNRDAFITVQNSECQDLSASNTNIDRFLQRSYAVILTKRVKYCFWKMFNFFQLPLNLVGKIRVSRAGEIRKVLDNGIHHLTS